MASKRIYQIAKEFECDEKKIIDFLAAQGIKVANRLSAVSEDTYNLLKTTLFAPPPPPPEPEPEPEPEPQPEPKPEPVIEQPAQVAPPEVQGEETPPQGGGKKKKKKKKKPPTPEEINPEHPELVEFKDQPVPFMTEEEPNAATQAIYAAGIQAGNDFIKKYGGKHKARLYQTMTLWELLQDIKFDNPDASPIRYWQAVAKLITKAFKLMQAYGMENREILGEMREKAKGLGSKYEPQEIFTAEENQLFEEQQKALFEAFGHGIGKINDNLFELKMYAERQKRYCEHMNFFDYVKNPDASKLESKIPMPFDVIAETILYSIRSVPCRVDFYKENKELILKSIEQFYAWIDGYKTLKEQGADADKLEKYLALEKKLFSLIEFMSFDNLIHNSRKKIVPFNNALDLLIEYRDNMDDPDAKRNFQYKVRGITNIIYKPKEYIFLYQFAELEPNVDYRPPEMIAEAEAAKNNEELEISNEE